VRGHGIGQQPIEEYHTGTAGALGTHYPEIESCSDDTGYALYRTREARQTAEVLLLSVHCTLWSVIRISASSKHVFTRIMLHDDVTIPYLVTMIDRGCHIRWLQRGGALRGRPHKTYNKRIDQQLSRWASAIHDRAYSVDC